MSILVTGVAGFIGFHVANRLLERGATVAGIDNLNDYYCVALKRARLEELRRRHGEAFRFVEVDFADAAALDGATRELPFDSVVHLGAQAGVRYSIENPRAYARSNIAGHLNRLEVARARDARHFV